MPTAQEIAEWMLDELTRSGELYQETAVAHVALKFGYEFTYDNENGNLAIRSVVFRRLAKDSVVWERGPLLEKTEDGRIARCSEQLGERGHQRSRSQITTCW
jgi:hypothetical protein